MGTKVIHVKRAGDVAAAAKAGARALRAGKLVAFPTETVYGIAAAANNRPAIARLRELKSRPKSPFSVHVGRAGDVARYVRHLPLAARQIIKKAWPGPVTLLLETGGTLADAKLQRAGLHRRLCADGIVGLRCPDVPVAAAMLSAARGPIVAPSANLRGQASPRTGPQVLESLDGRIDLLIDAGPTRYGTDSTVVRLFGDNWKIVRKGVWGERTIRRLARFTLMFVCTGNTCRSPIAAGLAKQLAAKRLRCRVSELRGRGVEIISAGAFAMDGGRATPEAVRAARRLGADISRHRSRKFTIDLINRADMIFCMTDGHVASVRRMAPSAAADVRRLSKAADIADPIGGGDDVYFRTAEEIRRVRGAFWDKEMS